MPNFYLKHLIIMKLLGTTPKIIKSTEDKSHYLHKTT